MHLRRRGEREELYERERVEGGALAVAAGTIGSKVTRGRQHARRARRVDGLHLLKAAHWSQSVPRTEHLFTMLPHWIESPSLLQTGVAGQTTGA